MEAVALGYLGAGIGAGLAIIGGGVGIGILANGAMHGMARQPQSAGTIQTGMLIAAAFIEGIAFLALVICFLMAIAKP
jgi:F-type H+-transporting ATPase subunit c